MPREIARPPLPDPTIREPLGPASSGRQTVIRFLHNGSVDTVPAWVWYSLQGPMPPFDFRSNGCTLSPDSAFGYSVRVACHWHDWPYSTESKVPRTYEARLAADRALRENIQWWMRRQNASAARAYARSRIYYAFVRHLGAMAFYKDGQYPENDRPPVFELAFVFKILKKIF